MQALLPLGASACLGAAAMLLYSKMTTRPKCNDIVNTHVCMIMSKETHNSRESFKNGDINLETLGMAFFCFCGQIRRLALGYFGSDRPFVVFYFDAQQMLRSGIHIKLVSRYCLGPEGLDKDQLLLPSVDAKETYGIIPSSCVIDVVKHSDIGAFDFWDSNKPWHSGNNITTEQVLDETDTSSDDADSSSTDDDELILARTADAGASAALAQNDG